jgi:hypothetical protein
MPHTEPTSQEPKAMTDFNGASMINETRRWLKWVEGGAAGAQRMIEIAKAKPAGLKQDSNLLLDDQGHVWERDWNRSAYAELARKTAFGPYAATGRIIPDEPGRAFNGGKPMTFSDPTFGSVTFVAKGWDQPEADWSWIPDNYAMSTLQYAQGTLDYNQRGVTFAKALLAVSAEELDAWTRRRAASAEGGEGRRARSHIDGDWPSFLAAFSLPATELPDSGSLRCHVHLMVDRAAGYTATSYAH